MTAPDWLITLFETLGLKTSEKKRLLREIVSCEERVRSINKHANDIVAEIKSIEAEYCEAKAEYDILQGVARETVSIRLENLLKQRERMSERNELLDHLLKAETLMLNERKLQLEHLHSRSADDLRKTLEDKEDIIDKEKEIDDSIEELDGTRLPGKPKTAPLDNDAGHDSSKYNEAIKTFNKVI